jgi:hypothetical protein
MSCPAERECLFSSKKIYLDKALAQGNLQWPVNIVVPDIEDIRDQKGIAVAEEALVKCLEEDYGDEMPSADRQSRAWYGRCVYEADNDVCDDQMVTIAWEDSPLACDDNHQKLDFRGRGAKIAVVHMAAMSEKICERRTRVYGTKGEIEADSKLIRVHQFESDLTTIHHPFIPGGFHGAGDDGLAHKFVAAIDAVKNNSVAICDAQKRYLVCTVEDILRSHAMVFAAESARKEGKVCDFSRWWELEVEAQLN